MQLTHLLDLKQKHANAFEARFARDQAAFTGRQGQTIMVFTIVTIVFLPMSFIAAFFAIPIQNFPHENGSLSIPFSYVSKIMFGVGFAVSIPLIAVAFALDNLGIMIKRTLRSLLAWITNLTKPVTQRRRHPQPSCLDGDGEAKLDKTSEETYDSRSSYEVESVSHIETGIAGQSVDYPRERTWRNNSMRTDRMKGSRDLERGVGVLPKYE